MPDRYSEEIEGLKAKLEKIEARTEFLYKKLNITPPNEALLAKPSRTVLEFMGKGDQPGAVRAFMRESGASLKDAKEYIQSL
jgi:hypothetical protein